MRQTSFHIGDMTIHQIVESEAPFMDAMEFLARPDARNTSVMARAGRVGAGNRQTDLLLSVVPRADATPCGADR
jgi:hypothetical protein